MTDKITERIVNEGVTGAEHLRNQTAEALEEAAQKLRNADISVKGEDVKQILQDIEGQVNQFISEIGTDYRNNEAYPQNMGKTVENIITDHPIPSVLIAAGMGLLIGMLITKGRN